MQKGRRKYMGHILTALFRNSSFLRGTCKDCGKDFIFTEDGLIMTDLSWSYKTPTILDLACSECKQKRKIRSKLRQKP